MSTTAPRLERRHVDGGKGRFQVVLVVQQGVAQAGCADGLSTLTASARSPGEASRAVSSARACICAWA
ncbi:hypothetical protein WJ973_25220 [Achromobacter xylosoxidans]